MKSLISFRAEVLLAPFALLTFLQAHARAQADAALVDAPGAAVILAADLASVDEVERVHYDEPGDGSLWARGPRWKASFDSAGAVYYAGFGPRQPRNLPHALSPDVVTVGGEPLAFERAASPFLAGDRVELDRGAFVEAYELAPESIEQLFVFESLPRAGDLVLHIPIASELEGVETDGGLEFRGEHGHVTYSRAVAIDARGQRAVAPTRIEGGAIVIEVEAEFLAVATFPLVIDPVVSQFWLDSNEPDSRAPDLCWDPFHNVWLAVYEEVFSATDTDILVRMLGSGGLQLASSYVDVSTASWTKPRCANNGSAHLFLVVAERSSTTPKSVVGRTVQPNGTILTMSSQFDIGGAAAGDKLTPDVGGDPRTSGATNFSVVFEHTVASGDSEIGYRLVTPAGVPLGSGPTYFADSTVEQNQSPTISRSNGGTTWLLAWVHRVSFPFGYSIFAARVRSDGVVVSAPFVVTGSSNAIGFTPCASSPLASTERCAITFAHRSLIPLGSPADILVSVLDGATVLQTVNLMTLEASPQAAVDQIDPSIDSDGQHFLVSYSEFDPTFSTYNTFMTDLHLAGNQLGVSQGHVQLHPGLGLRQLKSQVAAMRAPTAFARRYGVIYEVRANDQNYDISAVLVDGVLGGSTSSFCLGDGSNGNCPCGNNGTTGRGCGHSFSAIGALLGGTGVVSTVQDTFRLDATNLPPPSSQVTFFQGTSASSPATFGDGLRCATGTIVRIATVPSSSSQAAYGFGVAGSQPISVRGAIPTAGATRYYQATYRNSVGFCTSATFNVTNGIVVNWAR